MAETNQSAAISYYLQARLNGEKYPVVPQTLTRNWSEKVVQVLDRDPWDGAGSVEELLPLTVPCDECELLPRLPGSGLCLRCWLATIQPVEFES